MWQGHLALIALEVVVLSQFLTDQQVIACMEKSIAVAAKSISEPRTPPPPKVGALLVTQGGEIELEAFRNDGQHAEYRLLEEAFRHNKSCRGKILFTTLEPCTKRGETKIPCAERVAAEGFAEVFIGALDPDPSIRGRGELMLSSTTKVERYPHHYARKVREVSSGFFDAHADDPHSAHALYTTSQDKLSGFAGKVSLAEERNGLLQLTMDLIRGAQHEICILAGDLSWLGEAQAGILQARQRGCTVKCLVPSRENAPTPEIRAAATALGINVYALDSHPGHLGTLVDPHTASHGAAIFVDHGSATIFRRQDDPRMLQVLSQAFHNLWADREVRELASTFDTVSHEALIAALRAHVPQYRDASVNVDSVNTADLIPLTRYLERFKLERLATLEEFRAANNLSSFCVRGTLWPVIAPPVLERTPEGQLAIIDGTHRSYLASRERSTIEAIVVSNVEAELPATPLRSLADVRVFTRRVARPVRYTAYREDLFRPIGSAYRALLRSS